MRRALVGFAIIASLLFLSGIGAGWTIAQRPQAAPLPAERMAPKPYTLPLGYAQWVIYYCDESGVPVWLASRLFAWESGWSSGRVHFNDNGTRDLGIAQIHELNLASFAALYNDGEPIDWRDAETSIRVGIRFFASLHAQYGSWREAVRRYAGRRSESGTRWIMGEGI